MIPILSGTASTPADCSLCRQSIEVGDPVLTSPVQPDEVFHEECLVEALDRLEEHHEKHHKDSHDRLQELLDHVADLTDARAIHVLSGALRARVHQAQAGGMPELFAAIALRAGISCAEGHGQNQNPDKTPGIATRESANLQTLFGTPPLGEA